MTFTTKKLVNSRVLVTGSDIAGGSGSQVLDSSQWEELALRNDVKRAAADFDLAVDEFFAPILEAAEKAEKASLGNKPEDSTSYVVLDEGTEGVAAKPRQLLKLTKDSQILRLLEEGSGHSDRLVWVNDELEILEATPAAASTPVQGGGTGDE